MLPTTHAWVEKAEEDFDVVLLLLRSRKRSRVDPICFHCQQCAEKYLKGRLNEAGIAFPKTHDLGRLLNQCLVLEPKWLAFQSGLLLLTQSAVVQRYPGIKATAAEMRDAVRTCRRIRSAARITLGLK